MKISLISTVLYFSLINLFSQQLTPPDGLICELLREPEKAVITDATPEFGWIFPQAGQKQVGWHIRVASSPYLLNENNADIWDSGKMESDQSINVSYQGKALEEQSLYWWQVKVWSDTGLESAWSEPQQFITGNFDKLDLEYPAQSRWIELAEGQWVSEDKQCASFTYYNPQYVWNDKPGYYFASFDKSVIGILEFSATSYDDQTTITVYLGERKTKEDAVDKNPGKSNIGFEKVEMTLQRGTHHYVLQLPERPPSHYLHSQKLAPHYPEVMPFRFVEIQGEANAYRIDGMKQAALFYYFDDSASYFQSSNDKLNQVWDLCKYTLKATPFLGVYADGNRERMPYEADAYIQQLGHFSVDREYAIGKYTTNFLLDHASWPTEWQMHTILMAWDYYMYTGDTELFENRYEDLKRKSLIALSEENGLISTRKGKKTEEFLRSLNFPGPVRQFRDIVDWPHGAPKGRTGASNQSPLEGGETDGFVFNDFNAVVNAFHYRSLILMGKIAGIVGNKEDEVFFRTRAEAHVKAFTDIFFDEEHGRFRDGEATDHASLHANMFPLAFGMVPAEHVASVSQFVKSRGMVCSVYGAQYLLDALYQAGEADYALNLMTSDTKRSWLNMIRVGSSMTTEAWDEFYKPNLTWNHAWGSSPANVVARKLMGIEAISPSFESFRISPQPGKLTHAKLKMPTIRGTIAVQLLNLDDTWKMEISVPGNSDAELWLPGDLSSVSINGKIVQPNTEVRFAGESRNAFPLKAGRYTVVAKK